MLMGELAVVVLGGGILGSEDGIEAGAPAVEEGGCELEISVLGDFLGGLVEGRDV